MPNDLFGFDDPVHAKAPPPGFETVHQDGDTWAKTNGTREGTTRLTTRQANLMAGWFRGLRTIAGLDISDLANDDPTLLREILVRSIAAALPAEVANQLPALADLLDTDIDLVAALAASADFKNAVAADPDLANAVAADPDLVNALAALTAFVDAVAAALPLALNADNLASGTVPNARLPGRLQASPAAVANDWNMLVENGFYQSYLGSNEPGAGVWLGIVRRVGSRIYQEVLRVDTGAAVTGDAWYCRTSQDIGATWTAWQVMRPTEAQLNAKYARLASANTFSQQQTATSFKSTSGDFDSRAPVAANAHYWLRDEAGNPKAVVYWDRTPNDVRIANWGTGQELVLKGTGGLGFAGYNIRDTGNTPDGSSALAIAGTDTTKRAWDATDLKVAAQTWGGNFANHAWANVSGSRAINTSYQNTTGKVLMVAGRWKNSSAAVLLQVSSDNATWITVGDTSLYSNGLDNSALVPPGHYYRAYASGGTTTVQFWAELSA